METLTERAAEIVLLVFLAITFVQSGLDKVFSGRQKIDADLIEELEEQGIDGLVIDLRRMNDVGVNPGTRIVTVEQALEEHREHEDSAQDGGGGGRLHAQDPRTDLHGHSPGLRAEQVPV